MLRLSLQTNQCSMCNLHCSRNRDGGRGPNGQVVSTKRTADGARQRTRKIIVDKTEKYRAKNASLRKTSTDSKVMVLVILKNHASAPIRKERLSLTSKASSEASQNKFAKKGGMPNRLKNLG